MINGDDICIVTLVKRKKDLQMRYTTKRDSRDQIYNIIKHIDFCVLKYKYFTNLNC